MQTGAITSYIDVAQITLYAFWVFFAGLIVYLRREDKREGYPLASERSRHIRVQGFPAVPRPKTFLLRGGHRATVPNVAADRADAPVVASRFGLGAPLLPVGDPMRDGVGPASYADREDAPELNLAGEPSIVPMRLTPTIFIEPNDPDPHGMRVVGADGRIAGTVSEVWVDRADMVIRYLQLELAAGQQVLLPMAMARISPRKRLVRVKSILAKQFANVPGLAKPDQITKREEDRIVGYYGGGHLYAVPSRQEPFL